MANERSEKTPCTRRTCRKYEQERINQQSSVAREIGIVAVSAFPESLSCIKDAAALIRCARDLTAFTGEGISVESSIPPFRSARAMGSL